VGSASAKCHPRLRRCVAIVSSSDTAGSFSKDASYGQQKTFCTSYPLDH
jgi:hypothetical protein